MYLTNTISSTTVKTYFVDDAVLSHSSIVSDLGILTAYASSALLDSKPF